MRDRLPAQGEYLAHPWTQPLPYLTVAHPDTTSPCLYRTRPCRHRTFPNVTGGSLPCSKDPLVALTIASLPALLPITSKWKRLRRLLLLVFDDFFEGGGIAVGRGEGGIVTSRAATRRRTAMVEQASARRTERATARRTERATITR